MYKYYFLCNFYPRKMHISSYAIAKISEIEYNYCQENKLKGDLQNEKIRLRLYETSSQGQENQQQYRP